MAADRYTFLSLNDAEPDLGLPSSNNFVLVGNTSGTRSWSDSFANFSFSNNSIRSTESTANLVITPGVNKVMFVNTTSAIGLPVGTTSDRNTLGGAGLLRYNSDLTIVEYNNGTTWLPTAGLIADQTITGNGSSVYTLNYQSTTNGVLATKSNVILTPNVDYTVNSTTITFTPNLASNANVYVRFLSTGQTTVVPAAGGADTQVNFNDGGSLNGVASFTFTKTPGNLTVTGNIISGNFHGNGSNISGVSATSVVNGNSNVIVAASGNISTSVRGVSNVVVIANTGVTVNANVTANYFLGNGSQLGGMYSNSTALSYLGSNSAITILTTGNITTNANVTANYFIGNGAGLSGILTSYSNVNVAAYLNSGVAGGLQNTPIGNVTASTGAFTTITTTGNVTANALTVNTSAVVTTTLQAKGGLQNTPIGNVTPTTALFTTIGSSGNTTVSALTVNNSATIGSTLSVNGNVIISGNLTVTNVTYTNQEFITTTDVIGSNLTSNGLTVNNSVTVGTTLGVTGNVNASYYFGNGSQLTGIATTYSNTNVASYLSSNSAITISTTANITSNNHFANSYLYANGVNILTGVTGTYSNTNVASYLSSNSAITILTTGNVTANNHIGNSYLFANGVSIFTNITATTATTAQYVTGLTSANVTTALGFVPANSNAASSYGNTNVAAYLNSGVAGGLQYTPIGNVAGAASTGSFTSITANGNLTVAAITSNGTITATTVGAATIGNASATHVGGSYYASGNYYGVLGAATYANAATVTTLSANGNATVNGLTVNTSGVFTTTLQAAGGIQSTPIGNVAGQASTGSFTTITATGNITASALTINNSATIGTTLGVTGAGIIYGGLQNSALGNVTAIPTANITSLTVTTGQAYFNSNVNTNNIMPFGNANANIGSSALQFNTIFAKATSAQYADLAEYYSSDDIYPGGTVVDFGGSAEVTLSTKDMSTRIAGVISTNPAYLMNSAYDGGGKVVALALQGRVPCLVTGNGSKGDMMVSAGNGVARSEDSPRIGSVLGKSLEDFNFGSSLGVIEISVGRD